MNFPYNKYLNFSDGYMKFNDSALWFKSKLCRVGFIVVSVSASHTVTCEFAPRPGHTKDQHKNGTNCLPAWHAMR